MAIAAAAMSGRGGGGGGGASAAEDDDGHAHDLVMPGFRFHPTEEELIEFYLRRKVEGKRFNVELIAFLDLYRYDPWELPELATIGEKEWFFYVPRDRKYRNGDRPNRVTTSGYWKATGADRMIKSETSNRGIGLKKTLVFYTGKAPKGVRTSWIMNEYRLPHHHHHHHHHHLLHNTATTSSSSSSASSFNQGHHHHHRLLHSQSQLRTEISLCRVYKRAGVEDHCQLPAALSKPSPSSRRATAAAGVEKRHPPHPPPPPPRRQLNIPGATTLPGNNPPPVPPPPSAMETTKAPRLQTPTRSSIYGFSPRTTVPSMELEGAAATAAAAAATSTSLHPVQMPNTRSSLLASAGTTAASGMAAAEIDELNRLVGYSSNESSSMEQPNQQLLLQMPHQQIITPSQLPAMSLPMISEKLWEWWNPNNISEAAGNEEDFTGFK